MDSMDVNKGIAAVLAAGIAFFVTGLIGDNLIYTNVPEKAAVTVPAAPTAAAAKPAAPPPIIPLLASADLAKGKQMVDQVCGACHSLTKGGATIVGPNLYGIVGDVHDHESGFSYSDALEKYQGKPWTYEALNRWLDDPQTYAPGTHMTYTGVKNTKARADVIAYLRTLSDKPYPLPTSAEVKQAEGAAKDASTGTAPASP